MKPVVVVDLFCGAGGFTQGAIEAGVPVALAVDCWEPAARIHHANHNALGEETVIHELGDLEADLALIREHLKPFRNHHFHLHGSPPCQALSNASTRDPAEGMPLVLHFLELVKHLKPDSWSMENVVPMKKRLPEWVPSVVLNAADYGVPQTRRRCLAGEGWTAVPTHSQEEWVSVVDALPYLAEELSCVPEIRLEAMGSNAKRHADRPINQPSKTICGSGNQVGPRLFAHQVRLNLDGAGASLGKRVKTADVRLTRPSKTVRNNTPSIRQVKSTHAERIRSLTVEETAILQGFPAEYVWLLDGLRKRDVWTAIGNAVCPPVARAIIQGISHAN